jgi:hypothetical protein
LPCTRQWQNPQSGKLVVGVDEGTNSWGYRNPKSGTIEGLDVDS